MNKVLASIKSPLTNKWTVISSLSTITLVILLTNLFINRLFIDRITTIIDNELGGRLMLIAGKIAENIEYDILLENLPSSLESFEPADLTFLNGILETEQQQNDLQAIFIVDRYFRTVIAFPALYSQGEMVTHLVGDSLYYKSSLHDTVSTSKMYSLSGNYFKTAYAPLKNEIGTIIAVVIVEASAQHFSTIHGFQKYMNWGLVFTFLVLLVAIGLIYWVVTQYTRLQFSMQRNQRLASMGQMAATVAHEIRNPLGIIKSTAEVIKSRHFNKEKPDVLLEFIPTEVDRLNRLVTDFLAFARDRELQPEKQDVVEFIDKVVQEIQHDFEDDVHIRFAAEIKSSIIQFDPDGLKQVLINLFQNAAQAMQNQGEIVVSLSTISRWGKKHVQVCVQDSGPGITAPEKIFEPFFTTKTSGSGLGLAVTQQIITKHGGHISVENTEHGGALFTFTIPVV